jgi:hypothetical protein
MAGKSAISFVTTVVPFLVLRKPKLLSESPQLPSQLYQVYLRGYYNGRLPTCLAGWRLMLLTLGGVVSVVSVVSLHFSWPQ